jgi:hypothetical protein
MNEEYTYLDLFYLEESKRVSRQLKRVGGKLKRQYRCSYGEKQGRLVATPDKCGIRKDPGKVRRGKATARLRKKYTARKSARTKAHTGTKVIQRFNDYLKGDS